MDIEFKDCVFDGIKDYPNLAIDIHKAIERILEEHSIDGIGIKIVGKFKGDYRGNIDKRVEHEEIEQS